MVGIAGFKDEKYARFDIWNNLSLDIRVRVDWALFKKQYRKVCIALHPDGQIFRALANRQPHGPPGTSFTTLTNLKEDLEAENEISRDRWLNNAYERRLWNHYRTWLFDDYKDRASSKSNTSSQPTGKDQHSRESQSVQTTAEDRRRDHLNALFDKAIRAKLAKDPHTHSQAYNNGGCTNSLPTHRTNSPYTFEASSHLNTRAFQGASGALYPEPRDQSSSLSGTDPRRISNTNSRTRANVSPTQQTSGPTRKPLATTSGKASSRIQAHAIEQTMSLPSINNSPPPEFADHAMRSRPYSWVRGAKTELSDNQNNVGTKQAMHSEAVQNSRSDPESGFQRSQHAKPTVSRADEGTKMLATELNASDSRDAFSKKADHTLIHNSVSEGVVDSGHQELSGTEFPEPNSTPDPREDDLDRFQHKSGIAARESNSRQTAEGEPTVHSSPTRPRKPQCMSHGEEQRETPTQHTRANSRSRGQVITPEPTELDETEWKSSGKRRRRVSSHGSDRCRGPRPRLSVSNHQDDHQGSRLNCQRSRGCNRSGTQDEPILIDSEDEEYMSELNSRFGRLSSNPAQSNNRAGGSSSTSGPSSIPLLTSEASDSARSPRGSVPCQISAPRYPARGSAPPYSPNTFRYTVPVSELLSLSKSLRTNTVNNMIMAVVRARTQSGNSYPEYVVMASVPVLTKKNAMCFRVHPVDIEGKELPAWGVSSNFIRSQDIVRLGYWLAPFDRMSLDQRKAFLTGMRASGRTLPPGY